MKDFGSCSKLPFEFVSNNIKKTSFQITINAAVMPLSLPLTQMNVDFVNFDTGLPNPFHKILEKLCTDLVQPHILVVKHAACCFNLFLCTPFFVEKLTM